MKRIAFMLGLALVVLTACQPAATATPAAPAASATLPPPATLAPTPIPPTATPAPTKTPKPKVGLTLETLPGVWWVWDDQAGGPNHLTFNPDGRYVVGHGPYPGLEVASGNFALEKGVLTFLNGWWECGVDAAGSYAVRLTAGGTYLGFELVEDACALRSDSFKRWTLWKNGLPEP
jgi:hypothetical protein